MTLIAATAVALLTPVPAAHADTGAIAGTVKEHLGFGVIGNPLKGAEVVCGFRTETGPAFYRGRTNAKGRYALPDVLKGSYWCDASKKGYETKSKEVVVTAGRTTRADFELDKSLVRWPPVPVPPMPICLPPNPYCHSPIPR